MDIKRLHHSDLDFWTLMETRWRDMDSLSHINHAAYLSYMESARVDVYMQLGYSGIKREMDESTILASMEVHYFDQAFHPSKLEIGHRISRVGNKSFDFLAGIFHAENENKMDTNLTPLLDGTQTGVGNLSVSAQIWH